MKNYKQKYKTAIEQAKQELKVCGSLDCDTARQIFRFFPELKKSEDEKVRKEIIHLVKKSNEYGGYALHKDEADRMINWLEKQNKPQVRTGIEWVNIVDDTCNHRYAEEYAHGEYCHEQSFKWGFQEGVDWLEKQGSFHKGTNDVLGGYDCTLVDLSKFKEQTINKACEWLNKNVAEYHPRKGELRPIVNINAFRKAMEDEQ